MIDTEAEAMRWIRSAVQAQLGGAINGAWLDVIPHDVPFPAVRYFVTTRDDIRTQNSDLIYSRFDVTVLAVVESDDVGDTVPLAEGINVALHKTSGTTPKAVIPACVRMRPFRMTDVTSGRTHRHAGGTYRMWVYPAAGQVG